MATNSVRRSILLDIDHFKQVNDTYGHALGDAVISKVGIVIRACCGPHIPAARSGGEEFAVLLPGQDARQARELAEEIRARVERGRIRNRKEDQDIGGITISAGVAVRRGSAEIEAVLERADAALYVAKNEGRNRVAMEAALASIPAPTAAKSPETPPN